MQGVSRHVHWNFLSQTVRDGGASKNNRDPLNPSVQYCYDVRGILGGHQTRPHDAERSQPLSLIAGKIRNRNTGKWISESCQIERNTIVKKCFLLFSNRPKLQMVATFRMNFEIIFCHLAFRDIRNQESISPTHENYKSILMKSKKL